MVLKVLTLYRVEFTVEDCLDHRGDAMGSGGGGGAWRSVAERTSERRAYRNPIFPRAIPN